MTTFRPEDASSLFRCPKKFVDKFERVDPFNPQNTVRGFLCRKKGLMGGSLVITHVNGRASENPYLVYGTPKLSYPYQSFESTGYIEMDCASHYLAEKWNGMNVLFYSYFDADGTKHITAKSKMAPFLSDSPFGNYLSLTKEALESDEGRRLRITELLEEFHAVSFELCGTKEPHLVKYDFDLALKPLFGIGKHGKIMPIYQRLETMFETEDRKGWSSDQIIARCQESQRADFEKNEEFRRANGLSIKYEHDHFATEGKVLYLLDADGWVLNRTLYKIKPKCVEQMHQSRFDAVMEGRVREALQKIRLDECPLTRGELQEQLDMGPKEWGKYERDIVKFVESLGEKFWKETE